MTYAENKFHQNEFSSKKGEERNNLCEQLATLMTNEMNARVFRRTPLHEREGFVLEWLTRLRSWGHEFWSWDQTEDFMVWGPDYMKRNNPGLCVDFCFLEGVEVFWWDTREIEAERAREGRKKIEG